ncbi:MAG: formylglycine-generating enzyme family protein [bacterium]|nr:formylglycine-generating enzyme family protein [bacterium]
MLPLATSRTHRRAALHALCAGLALGIAGCRGEPGLGPIDSASLAGLSDPADWEHLDGMEPPRRLRDPRTGIVFVRIPAGEFRYSPPGVAATVTVAVTRPFLLAETEVTAAQFRRFADRAAKNSGLPVPPTTELPMPLSWDDSREFCRALGYRLPTEAEWELACRADHERTGSAPAPWSSAASVREFAWFNATAGTGPRPVATRAANGYGLHDMLGNVWEWCADCYAPVPFLTEAAATVTDPVIKNDEPGRSLRGASWFTPGNPRPTDRTQDFPNTRNAFYGLRPARDL